MIIDQVKHILDYEPMIKGLSKAMEEIKNVGDKPEGRYEFEGGFYMIQSGETKPLEEGTFEAHRKYIDIQIILEGKEELAWCDIEDLESCVSYDDKKDVERFEGAKECHISITKGMFYIVFPHDGHKAVSYVTEKSLYKKIVLKLPV